MNRLEPRLAFVEPSRVSQHIYEEMPEQPGDALTRVYEDVEAAEVEEDATAADIIATAVGNFEGQYSQPNVVDPHLALYSTVKKPRQRAPSETSSIHSFHSQEDGF
jgi:hypothetical protein